MDQSENTLSPPSPAELSLLCERAKLQRLPPGKSFVIDAPPSLAQRLAQKEVEAVHLPDGHIAVLMKTTLGWKGNFRGFLYVTRPVSSNEMKNDNRGNRFVSLPAPPPWEELYLQSMYNDQLSEVFFDLN
jgi:hypothetical protein